MNNSILGSQTLCTLSLIAVNFYGNIVDNFIVSVGCVYGCVMCFIAVQRK